MTVYFLSVIIIFIVTVICPSESLFCSYGERFSLCGNHKCVPSCKHPQGPRYCEPKCRPGCVCNSGLVRRETDNKCVPIEECPKKRPQERRQNPRIPDKEALLQESPPDAPFIPDEEPGPEESHERPGQEKFGPEEHNERPERPGQENFGPEESEERPKRPEEENILPEESDERPERPGQENFETEESEERPKSPGEGNILPGKSEESGKRLLRQRQGNLLNLGMCPEGEKFSVCDNHQCQPTCKHLGGPKGCKPTCRSGCVCTMGRVRRDSDHECVHPEHCPRKGPGKRPKRPGQGIFEPEERPERPGDGYFGGSMLRSKTRVVGWSPQKSRKCPRFGVPRPCRKRPILGYIGIGPRYKPKMFEVNLIL